MSDIVPNGTSEPQSLRTRESVDTSDCTALCSCLCGHCKILWQKRVSLGVCISHGKNAQIIQCAGKRRALERELWAPRACIPWQCLWGGSCISPCCAGKESKDHEKENVRRIKEIQKKCKERERAQEHSQPKPVKALWKSQKYENVESKVKAKLQVSTHWALELSWPGMWVSHEVLWDGGDGGVMEPTGLGTTWC